MIIGMIAPYGAPVTTQAQKTRLEKLGWLLCDGREVDREIYADLFQVIGSSWGDGDGVDSFNLPDLRGYFMRGVDHGSGHDPEASTRTTLPDGGNSGDRVGSYQPDAFAEHSHTYVSFAIHNTAITTGGKWTVATKDDRTGVTGGPETRPKNVYVEFLICWKVVTLPPAEEPGKRSGSKKSGAR